MGAALLALRLVLASVFVLAGAAKLVDLAGSRKAVAEFGVPERLAGAAGTLLPVVELAVGLALIPVQAAPYAAVGAAVLLASFAVGIGSAIAQGRSPDCHCFGQVHSAPAGARALARDLVLLAAAAFVAVAGWHSAGISATRWVTQVDSPWLVAIAAGIVIIALVSFQVWFSLQLLSQNGRTLSRLAALEARLAEIGAALGLAQNVRSEPVALGEGLRGGGLAVGSPAPGFELEAVDGEPRSLASLLPEGGLLMLVFSEAGCRPCEALMPRVAGWQREHRVRLRLAVIAAGDAQTNREKAIDDGLELVLLQREREVSQAYEAHGTPMAVIIDPDGTIASPTVGGAEAIATLVSQTAGLVYALEQRVPSNGDGARLEPDSSRVGEEAPQLVLSDLDGERVALRELYGERTLAIFWNPGCGFCQQMLPDLKRFESDPPAGAPRLVLICAGDAERVREQAIRSLVLLDPDGEAMRAFGADGTPMAVVIDAGRITSHIAAGADEVLQLARRGSSLQVIHAGKRNGDRR